MIKDKNFIGFIWHAFWLALSQTFAEKNVVLPGLILFAGGTQEHVGILTSIMIGIPLITQLLFASYLTNKTLKKKFLLWGIYLRVSAFLGVGLSIFFFDAFSPAIFILIIFIWMGLFALSGAFAGISYTDIVGKSFDRSKLKKFFVTRQFLTGGGIFISALIVDRILTHIKYPENYQTAFITAAALLLIASFGFLYLKEKPSKISHRYNGFIEVLKKIPEEIKLNSNLKYFVIAANLIGMAFVLIPFYLGFIKQSYTLTTNEIGNFLLVQITGMIISNFIWNKVVKKLSFKGMLNISVILLSSLPLLALVLNYFNNINLFYLLFLFTGSAISAQRIALDGVIIEISNEANRPLYTGIFGTLNLTSALIPIILGIIFAKAEYAIIFITFSIITMYALVIIKKMMCPVDLE